MLKLNRTGAKTNKNRLNTARIIYPGKSKQKCTWTRKVRSSAAIIKCLRYPWKRSTLHSNRCFVILVNKCQSNQSNHFKRIAPKIKASLGPLAVNRLNKGALTRVFCKKIGRLSLSLPRLINNWISSQLQKVNIRNKNDRKAQRQDLPHLAAKLKSISKYIQHKWSPI